ncbi:MAG: elongation factor G [Bacillota bacterium]|nr:elongation factor G [Bacillota bacterium]
MAFYPVNKIKNICLLGHGGDGKTSLAESILFLTKQVDRLGKISDGTTALDYDSEEIKRQFSISASVAPIEYEGYKINLIDTPGYFDFAGEVMQALRVADAGLICVTAKSGVAVGTEKAWKYLSDRKLPRMFYVSKADEENARFYKVLESLREKFGVSVCPVVIPILEGDKTVGVCDVISKKGYKMDGGKLSETAIPASMNDMIEEYRAMVKESAAEASDEMMEKFFNDEEFTDEELYTGIHAGVLSGAVTPVFCGSAFTGFGTLSLLNGIIRFAPSPNEMPGETGVKENGETVEVKYTENGPTILEVFKTVADQYGRFSFFKVVSGKVTSDMTLVNSRTGESEKMGHIYVVKGKKNTEVQEIGCGDIGAVAKLAGTKTGDTLCGASNAVTLKGIDFVKPCYSQAISPKVKGNEEKIATGLTRLKDEDPSFSTEQNVETKQMVISGAGDIHIDVLCSKLKNKFGVEVELSEPRVPYREKIRKKVTLIEGKHKKQSGGHGQYGHVKMDFEPITDHDFIFEEKIFGGSVPKNFHPAVEKGIRESMQHGVLAGYPMVGLKATLVDGSYHDVDSNELSFKMAARLAYKAGIPQAGPVLLEPVGHLKVFVPDSYMGDVIGDLNKRRGRVLGMTPTDDGQQMVEADVPMAEIYSYAIDLRSMTQGRGSFDFEFDRYEEAPANVQQKIIEEAKLIATEEEE